MGFLKPKPKQPIPVDPYVQAQAQTGINRDAALTNASLSRINQYTPYGSMTYKVGTSTPSFNESGFNAAQSNFSQGLSSRAPTREEFTTAGVPEVSSHIDFTPEGRQQFDQQNRISTAMGNTSEQLAGRAQEAVGQPFNFDNAPALRSSINRSDMQSVAFDPKDYGQERQQVIDSVFNDQASRLDPRFEQQQRGLETQLANQGITRGSEAWQSSMDGLGRDKNDAYRGALAQALQQGGGEQSRLAGMDLQNLSARMGIRQNQNNEAITDLQLNNDGRTRSIEEQTFLRDRPMNELNSFRTGVHLQGPQFSGPAIPQGVGPASIGGAFQQQYDGQMARYNAQVSENNALTNGLFSMGAAAMGMPGGMSGMGGGMGGLFKFGG